MTCFFSFSSVTKNMRTDRRYDGELKPKMRRRDMQYGSKAQKRSDDVNELGLRHQIYTAKSNSSRNIYTRFWL